jgi:hypothetical protein
MIVIINIRTFHICMKEEYLDDDSWDDERVDESIKIFHIGNEYDKENKDKFSHEPHSSAAPSPKLPSPLCLIFLRCLQ